MPKALELTGQRFGKLVVLAYSFTDVNRYWLCQCDCGRQTIVNGSSLTRNSTKSCGCIVRKYGSLRKEHRAEYDVWRAMITRCNNPDGKSKAYKNISVCERWKSFKNFMKDMGPRPDRTYSIDRIDGTKNYTPENCQWATPTEQARNRKSTRIITHNGKTQCLQAWAEELGINPSTIHNRIRRGMPLERALSQSKWNGPRILTFMNLSQTIIKWSKDTGIPVSVLQWRLGHGWSIDRSLSEPYA